MINILLIEDHAVFRGTLAFVLTYEPDLEVVAQAGSVAEVREMLEGNLGGRLDVAVVDLGLPDGDGRELIGELRRSSPGIYILILSAMVSAGSAEELVQQGADAVLEKVQAPSTIASEIRRLTRG
jgi:two-component system, NarL family, response regulator DevR